MLLMQQLLRLYTTTVVAELLLPPPLLLILMLVITTAATSARTPTGSPLMQCTQPVSVGDRSQWRHQSLQMAPVLPHTIVLPRRVAYVALHMGVVVLHEIPHRIRPRRSPLARCPTAQ